MRDASYKVALGGIVSALCVAAMFIAGIVPALYLLLPMAAGLLLMIIAAEVSISWAFLTYLAVSILSVFVTADKEAALVFVMVFGHYPILRCCMEKIKLRGLKTLLKFLIFNTSVILFFYVTVFVFGMKEMLEEMEEFGKYSGIVMLVICNFLFIMYDFNLESFYKIYRKRFRSRIMAKK